MPPPTEYASILRRRAERAGIVVDSFVPPQERWAQLGAMRFRYLDWGGDDLPAIVFLHGGALSAHAWDLVSLALRDRFRCIALDQRGHGDSDWSETSEYTLAPMTADARAFLEYLRLGPVRLVGHSMGGLVSLGLVHSAPEAVSHLAIVDVGPEPRAEGADEIREVTEAGHEFESLDAAVETMLKRNPARNADTLRRSLLIAMRQLPNGRWRWKFDPRRVALVRSPSYVADRRRLWEAVPSVRCPTLIVHGGRSRLFLREDAERMLSLLPRGRLVTIDEASHNVHAQAPARLAELLAEHFAA